MAHFAKIDSDKKVVDIIVVHNDVILDADGNENEQIGLDFIASIGLPGRWVQCSYNGSIRSVYPAKGFIYDDANDVFLPNDDGNQNLELSDEQTHYILDDDSGEWLETAS